MVLHKELREPMGLVAPSRSEAFRWGIKFVTDRPTRCSATWCASILSDVQSKMRDRCIAFCQSDSCATTQRAKFTPLYQASK